AVERPAEVVDGVQEGARHFGAGGLDLAVAVALDALAEGLAVVEEVGIRAGDLVEAPVLLLEPRPEGGELVLRALCRRRRGLHFVGGLVAHGRRNLKPARAVSTLAAANGRVQGRSAGSSPASASAAASA